MNDINDKPETIARQMILAHGPRAPVAAAERLNECIDQGDKHGRDYWVQVVYEIHRLQRRTDAPLNW